MRLFLLTLALLFVVDAEAQERPAQADLDEVTRLGRMLYGYDQAAWHGTDAVLPVMERDGVPMDGTGSVRGYIAEPTATGWRLAFGKLSADSAAFHVAYEAILDSAHVVTSVENYGRTRRRGPGSCATPCSGWRLRARASRLSRSAITSPCFQRLTGSCTCTWSPRNPNTTLTTSAATLGIPTTR